MSNVILIAGEKGGTGKSTLSVNMAVMLKLTGHDVKLIDATKKQASSHKFISRRHDLNITPIPTCSRLEGKYLNAELEEYSKKHEWVIVDTGGFDSVEMRSAMACANVHKMYSPFKMSEFDLETLEAMNELVYLSLTHNPNLTCHVVFNQIPTIGTTQQIINEAKELANSFECIKAADTHVYNRLSILQAAGYGQTVIEYEEERRQKLPAYRVKDYLFKGSLEMCALYKEIFNQEFSSDKFESLREYQEGKEYQNSTIKETTHE